MLLDDNVTNCKVVPESEKHHEWKKLVKMHPFHLFLIRLHNYIGSFNSEYITNRLIYSSVRRIRRYNLILHRSAIYEEHTHRYCIERRPHCKSRYRL